MVIRLVYLAPGIIVMMGGVLVYMMVSFGGAFAVAGNQGESAGTTIFALIVVAMAILFISSFVGWLLWALAFVPLPAALMHFVAQDRLGAAFQLRDIALHLCASRALRTAGWCGSLRPSLPGWRCAVSPKGARCRPGPGGALISR